MAFHLSPKIPVWQVPDWVLVALRTRLFATVPVKDNSCHCLVVDVRVPRVVLVVELSALHCQITFPLSAFTSTPRFSNTISLLVVHALVVTVQGITTTTLAESLSTLVFSIRYRYPSVVPTMIRLS